VCGVGHRVTGRKTGREFYRFKSFVIPTWMSWYSSMREVQGRIKLNNYDWYASCFKVGDGLRQ